MNRIFCFIENHLKIFVFLFEHLAMTLKHIYLYHVTYTIFESIKKSCYIMRVYHILAFIEALPVRLTFVRLNKTYSTDRFKIRE